MTSKAIPTASDAFLGSVISMTNDEDMQGILDAQNHMLGRFEKTNEMLSNFNSLSGQRYNNVHQQFTTQTQLLLDMKADLDAIFRRLRHLKFKLARDYPRAFAAASQDERKLDLGEVEASPQAQTRPHRALAEKVEPTEEAQGQEDEPSCETADSESNKTNDSLENNEPPVYLVD